MSMEPKEESWRTFEQRGASCRLRGDAAGCARAYYEAAQCDRFLRSQREHYSSYLFTLHYLPGISAEELARQHFVYGQLYRDELATNEVPAGTVDGGEKGDASETIAPETVVSVARPDERRLRIGFLAPDFLESSAARFYEALLGLPQDAFEVFAYSLSDEADDFTQRVQSMVAHYRVLSPYDIESSEQAIAKDGLDALIDLGGHTAGGATLMLLAHHPARSIIEAVGWFDTTGLPTVDYLLTDGVMDPPGREALLSERPLRLPHAWCFTPSRAMQEVRAARQTPASLSEGGGPEGDGRSGGGRAWQSIRLCLRRYVFADHHPANCFALPSTLPQSAIRLTAPSHKGISDHIGAKAPCVCLSEREPWICLASFQNFLKISDGTLDAWRTILERAPQAHLRLQDTMRVPARVTELERRLRAAGLPMARVTAKMGSDDYLDDLARQDLILDTFPYPGGAMTATALYLGVPVLTLRGDNHSRSVGASILTAAGLPELVAEDVGEYVEKAVGLAVERERLVALQDHVWKDVSASPLCDCERYRAAFIQKQGTP